MHTGFRHDALYKVIHKLYKHSHSVARMDTSVLQTYSSPRSTELKFVEFGH